MHTVLDKGVLKKVEHLDKDHLEFPSAKDFFALPSNLIPGLSGVSGGRVLLGSKSTLQAVSLVNREPPLVQSHSGTKGDKTFVEQFGKNLLSITANKDGTVTAITKDEITVKNDDKSVSNYFLYNNFNLGRKSFVQHYPRVKVGDKIKEGEVIATSNYTDDKGTMAMGINLRTAIMPYRSGNFEDAWVVTESGAKKLDAEMMMRVRTEKKFGLETDKDRFVSLFPNKFLNAQLGTIDQDGVVKVGTILHDGDPIILSFTPKALKSTDVQLGKLSKVLKNAFRNEAEMWHYEHPGEVVEVNKAGDLITVHIKTRRSLAVGDKISNAWGAKGVVGQIISDTQAPVDKDGKPVDIMLNSMSVTSRVAPAIAVTLGLGKLAQKEGRTLKMSHFTEKSSVGNVIDLLKKNNISDTETLYDPITNREMNVMVGPLYFTRLTHIAEDKESSRSQGVAYSWDQQPAKTEDESAKKLGNLATNALLSHGATAVLRDIATIRGTRNDEFWRALKLGQQPPPPKVPFVFNKFIAMMQGAGINVTRKGNQFHIFPMVDKDIAAISNGAINSGSMFKIKKDNLVPEPGGLFDPTKVGIFGDRFNHIDLNMTVPNPISEEYLRKLLGVTQKVFESYILDGTLKAKLEAIDIAKKIADCKKYVASGKSTKRDENLKVLTFLNALKARGLHPKDLMLTKVPIIPAQYRPATAMGDITLTSDINNLYKDLILNNNSVKNLEYLPEDIKNKLKASQYAGVKAVWGLGDPITQKHKEKNIKGLLKTALGVKGGSAKMTMFQSHVVNKTLDLVGRAVLTPDAKLDIDQAAIPQDLIWHIYKPFMERRMIMKGVPAVKATEYIEARNPIATQALNEELVTRPGIVSRDPSLHKFNLTGFYLIPNPNPKDKTIKLNPLVFKSFNADNDGDQLNISVPAGDDARKEILEKMLPSRNLLSPKTIAPVYTPSNEAALGLFQLSTEHKGGAPKKYKTEKEVVEAYKKGLLHPGDPVEIG